MVTNATLNLLSSDYTEKLLLFKIAILIITESYKPVMNNM